MKLLYTAFDVVPAPKGASVRIQQMLQALSQLRPQPEVRAVLLGAPGYAAQETLANGVQIERLLAPEASFLARSVAFAERVLSRVQDWQPDVVQFRSLWDAYPLVRFRERYGFPARLVYELHGLPEYELEHHFPDLPAALLRKLREQQQVVLQAADQILCPSSVHRDYLLQQGLPAERIAWVPNGVELTRFVPGPEPDNERPVILYLGTLAPWQGLETLLEALQWVQAPFRLRLVGKGQRRWLQALLTKAFQLRLSHALEVLDPYPHELIPALIQAADLTLAPLDNSPRNVVQGCMPLKILEYMACGKAVLAADLPVTRALLEHGQSGWLYPAADPQALQQALETLLQQPTLRQQLGNGARQRAETQFGWQHSHQKLAEVYARSVLPGLEP